MGSSRGVVILIAATAMLFVSSRAEKRQLYFLGNHTVKSFVVSPPQGTPDGVYVHVWTPCDPGQYPTLAFASAFGMNFPARFYDKLFSRLASHGVVIAAVSKFNDPDYPTLARDMAAAVDWMAANHSSAIQKQVGCGALADVGGRLLVGGHSAGNHIATRMLEDGCGLAKAAVLLDPVDGVDPYGFVKQYAIHPPAKVNFTIPALHVETGNDPVPASPLVPACAPANMSNSRFYNAWRGPIWQVNATDFGHLDVCDPGAYRWAASPICKQESGLDFDQYRNTVAGLIRAFIAVVFDGDTGMRAVLEDPAQIPLKVVLQHDFHELPIQPGCVST